MEDGDDFTPRLVVNTHCSREHVPSASQGYTGHSRQYFSADFFAGHGVNIGSVLSLVVRAICPYMEMGQTTQDMRRHILQTYALVSQA